MEWQQKKLMTDFEEKQAYLYQLKEFFMEGVSKLPGVTINSLPGRESAPQIVSVSFAGVRSEVLLHALEEKGIFVSSGSACSSNKKLPVSTVLKEIGLPAELLDSTLRFSFCTAYHRRGTDVLSGHSGRTASGTAQIFQKIDLEEKRRNLCFLNHF